jgi:hypothetical protein
MRSFRFARALLALPLLFAGCATPGKQGESAGRVARFFLESGDGEGVPAILPRSGVALRLNPKPVITESDVVGADVAEVDLGWCVRFQLAPAAARDLYRLSVVHQGRRLVLQVDGVFLGARRIDGAIADGRVFTFVEIPDDSLPLLVEDIKVGSAAARRKDSK